MSLELRDIHKHFGSVRANDGVSMSVESGSLHGLLGENGAGKTTTLRSIIGLTPPRSGSATFDGQAIAGKQPFQVARMGIGFVPEDRVIFPDLTVRENLEMGGYLEKSKDMGNESENLESKILNKGIVNDKK